MEKLARQLTIKYAFLQSAFWVSQCCIFSFAAVFLQFKNFNNVQIGVVLALAAILSIVLQPLVAAFADKNSKISLRHIVLALKFFVLLLAVILYLLPDSFLLISIVYVLINAIQFTLIPLYNALALEYLNKGIPINYGLARGTGSIAFALTSYVLGLFINHFGPNVLLSGFLISYLFVILSAYLFKLSDEDLSIVSANLQINNSTDNCEYAAPTGIFTFFVKYKKFTLLLIGLILLHYSHNLMCTYLINIVEHVGGNSSDMGISLSIAAALELPTMAAFIFIIRKVRCSTLVKISAFFYLLKVVIAWLAPNVYGIHLSQSFQMLAFALFTPASIYYVNSIIEKQDKVKGQSMLGVAITGISGTIANLTGGKILDSVGVSDMLLVGTIITAIGFVIVFFATEKTELQTVVIPATVHNTN